MRCAGPLLFSTPRGSELQLDGAGGFASHVQTGLIFPSGVRRVVPEREAKSISNKTTFAEEIAAMEILRAWLEELVE